MSYSELTIDITEKNLRKMGFFKVEASEDNLWEYNKPGNITVLVGVLDFGRFTVSIMLEDHYANHAKFVISDINNIKDLTDLENFISYL
jgi:hypothetical protein